jgi:hypothetical protein
VVVAPEHVPDVQGQVHGPAWRMLPDDIPDEEFIVYALPVNRWQILRWLAGWTFALTVWALTCVVALAVVAIPIYLVMHMR